jgi:hypothetical protein
MKDWQLACEGGGDDISRERGHKCGTEDRRSKMPLDLLEDEGESS